MQILVTGRHVEITNDVRAYVEDKTSKLSKYYNRIHEIEVVLDHESDQFKVEVIVRAGHKHTFVSPPDLAGHLSCPRLGPRRRTVPRWARHSQLGGLSGRTKLLYLYYRRTDACRSAAP